jgi:biopolymer transport protein ExbD
MGKFNKGGSKEVPELNTSSLPDLIFSILFFFMMVTSMREVTMKVEVATPKGTEIEKLEKKSLVTYVYVGKPTKEFRSRMGTASQIQLNDDFASVDAIGEYIYQEREAMPERDKPFMKVSMKIDEATQMGIVTDIKMALREAWALNIVYSGGKRQ